MRLAGRVGWVGVVTALGLLAAGALAIERAHEPRIAPDLRLVAAPQDLELSWGVAPAPRIWSGRPDIARERSPELPAWFGLAHSPSVRIAGRVRGAVASTTIRLSIDVPDPGIWTGRELAVGADGAFDFGPMRPGRYLLVASAPGKRSHVTTIDTLQAPADGVELPLVPCVRVRGAVEQPPTTPRGGDWGPARGAAVELAGTPIGTTDGDGAFDVCAADESELRIRGDGFAPIRWLLDVGVSRRARPAELVLDEVQTGTVFEADGAPAVNVGVQPIWGSLLSREICVESDVVVTTDRDGQFTYVGARQICGLRIYRGTTMYEAPLGVRPTTTTLLPPPPPPPPPLHWPDTRELWLPPAGPVLSIAPLAVNPGVRGHLIARLRDPVRDPAAGFGAARARMKGKPGTWIHGRVVHDGAPVPDAVLTTPYRTSALAWLRVPARHDGSFDVFLSRNDADCWMSLDAVDRDGRWNGRAVIQVGVDPPARDVTIEIGVGLIQPEWPDEQVVACPGVGAAGTVR